MRIQSLLVLANIEVDYFDENGVLIGTRLEQIQAENLEHATRLLGLAHFNLNKGGIEDARYTGETTVEGFQPKDSGESEAV